MNSFVNALREESNWTTTENGADALKSTTDALVDLFGVIGALRNRCEKDVEQLFIKAFCEDKLLATKMSFYARGMRSGGLGERKTARIIWKYLANNYPDIMRKNLELVPEFGRYDDLYTFVGTPIEKDMWELVRRTISKDILDMNLGRSVTLLAKWLKSINTSSKESKQLGKLTAKALGMTDRVYRKTLSTLRNYIDVTEVKMTSGHWDDIEYSKVPSKAMNNYRNAFKKHDKEGFDEYIEKVKNGTSKINAGVLYPYDIVEKYLCHNNRKDSVLEEQWKALPNYVDTDKNILIMADVSGSMWGRPMATSVGLAIYFAERNKGDFHGKFMTFSSSPEFVEIPSNKSLCNKVRMTKNADWGMSTDLEAAFKLVLDTAVKHHIPKEDMPRAIVVISDMEFDRASNPNRSTFYDYMKNKFESEGYEIPNLVFWNVESRHDAFHAKSNYKGVQLASGQSASVFKAILSGIDLTPYNVMVNTLSDPIYDCVRI